LAVGEILTPLLFEDSSRSVTKSTPIAPQWQLFLNKYAIMAQALHAMLQFLPKKPGGTWIDWGALNLIYV
jgi:hypothetical protein